MPTTGESVGVVALMSLALKLLLLPSYQSAEFARQRAWMALAHGTPPQDWYFESQSPWPLDFPPVFAYLKFVMAEVAFFALGPDALAPGHEVPELVAFERLSVILMDSALLLGILLYCSTWPVITTTDMEWSRNKVVVVVALILFNPGLIMVDHIYLHYSGYAIGILSISIAFLRRGDDLGDLLGAVTYVVLVLFDHTFLAVSPLYFVYLVRHFCCATSGNAALNLRPTRSSRDVFSASDGFTSDEGPDAAMTERARGRQRPLRAEQGRSDEDDDEDEPSEDEDALAARVQRIKERRRQRIAAATTDKPDLPSPMEEEPSSHGVLLRTLREMSEARSEASPGLPAAGNNSPTGPSGKGEEPPLASSAVRRADGQPVTAGSDGPAIEATASKSLDTAAATASATECASLEAPRRRPGHRRNHSDISHELRQKVRRARYDRFLVDAAALKSLVQRPRAKSDFEIASEERYFSPLRGLVLLLSTACTALIILAPLLLAHGNAWSLLGQLYMRLSSPGTTACRDYWAPNIWALYSGVDRILAALTADASGPDEALAALSALGTAQDAIGAEPTAAVQAGLVVLPEVHPLMTGFLTLVAMAPALSQVWHLPHQSVFLPVFVYSMTCHFMLGFHIEEKSVLYITVPLTLASCDSTMDARLYLLMSWIAHVSLLPILETPDLKVLKPVLLLVHCFGSFIALDQYHIMARRARRIRPEPNGGGVWLWAGDRAFFYGLAGIYLFAEVVHPVVPFFASSIAIDDSLPLMAISIYCAAGMVHCWALAFQQVSRKVAVIESYQWSPRGPVGADALSDHASAELSRMPHLSLFER